MSRPCEAMPAANPTATSGLIGPSERLSGRPARWRRLFAVLPSVVGSLCLAYVAGAAAMYFRLPTSASMHKAFIGAQAWYEQREGIRQAERAPVPQWDPSVEFGEREKVSAGLTLCMPRHGTVVSLRDLHGRVVHEWRFRFSDVWPRPVHLPGPVRDELVQAYCGHLFANGDLLVVLHGIEYPALGYGLVKLDKDSHVLWKHGARAHHSVDVGDDGTVYCIAQTLRYEMPKGMESIPVPCIVDSVDVLSPDGAELKSIPLLDALLKSPYAPLLSALETPTRLELELDPRDARRRDVLHTNHVEVLDRRRAPRFPLFKPGQILFSMRHIDLIGVLDPESRSVVWAARGPWKGQHDPHFLDNGHLLLFDNLGSLKGSRVLEYDPRTQSFPWSYAAPVTSEHGGMSQRLPNGNTLVVLTTASRVVEVTPGGEVVWSCSWGAGDLHLAHRYRRDQLAFLKGT